MQTMCKSGLYPTSEQEQSLLFVMKICWWVYNHFLSIWDSVAKMPSRYDLQAALLELKTPFHECKPGRYQVAVKVVDIFGNDTMKIIEVSV